MQIILHRDNSIYILGVRYINLCSRHFSHLYLLLIATPNLSIYTRRLRDFRESDFGLGGKRKWQRGEAVTSIRQFVKYDSASPPSPVADVFRTSDSPPSDPAECRGIRNWELACHKY